MILKVAQVTNFRSIVDSGPVSIEDGVTVLIGKNEQGKTNFLKALQSFNPDVAYKPGDLPNHLRPELEESPKEEIRVLNLVFELEPSDRVELQQIVDDISSLSSIRVNKWFDGSYSYYVIDTNGNEEPLSLSKPDASDDTAKIVDSATALQEKLLPHAARVPEFAQNNEKVGQIVKNVTDTDLQDLAQIPDIVKSFSTAMKGLPSQDEAIKQDISVSIKEMDAAVVRIRKIANLDQESTLWEFIPRFVFHSARLDTIPNEVVVSEFIGNPNVVSRGMHNLCRAAGLSIQKIKELSAASDTSQVEAYEDHYKGTISGGLNEFWTQEKYQVHFRIETNRLSVSISDGTYSPRIAPSDRSEGFQWYLSFYTSILNEVSGGKSVIFLLDNPGLELHVDGQRDIKQFLEVKVSGDGQVIYVTHSPALVDSFNLAQVRSVTLHEENAGTKIESKFVKEGDDLDLLEPVRTAIGASLVSSLIFNDFNILVEGSADKAIVEGAIKLLMPDLRDRVLVNGSISESRDGFLAVFYSRTKLPFIVLLDADSSGRSIASQLNAHGIDETHILPLSEVFKKRGHDFALEDVISRDFYHQAVMETYPGKPVDKPEESDRMISNVYTELYRTEYGIGFSKRRVAEKVKQLLLKGKGDKPTLANLTKILKSTRQRLESQVSPDSGGKGAGQKVSEARADDAEPPDETNEATSEEKSSD